MGDLTDHFSRSEFTCHCGCGYDLVDLPFVRRLEVVRAAVGFPMRVNSGCRCPAHNAAVGGVKDSAHMRGLAADISVLDSERRVHLIAAAIHSGFTRIGIGRDFIHLDSDPSLPQPRMWLY